MKKNQFPAFFEITVASLEQNILSKREINLNRLSILTPLALCLSLNPIDLYAGPVLNPIVLPNPLNCESKFYQNHIDTLKILDMNTGTYTSMGASTNKYNAIDWDRRTNLIYGIDSVTRELLVFGDTGVGTILGVPTPLIVGTIFPDKSYAGAMDENGNLWFHDIAYIDEPEYKGYKINVDNNTFEEVIFTFNNFAKIEAKINDLVYVKNTGSMWGINKNNALFQFHLDDKTVTKRLITGLPVELKSFGAGFTFADDGLYFHSNTFGNIYKISDYTSNTPSATLFVTGEITQNNDGASCPLAAAPIPPGSNPPLVPLNFGEYGRFNIREINSPSVE